MNTAATLESRKFQLITQITRLENEALLRQLERVLAEGLVAAKEAKNTTMFRPMRKKLRLEDLKKEQHYTGMDLARMDQSIEALDIPDSIDDLLAQLTP